MNPVRTLGPAVVVGNYSQIWIYLLAPTTGALLGAVSYTIVKLKEDVQDSKSSNQSRNVDEVSF